MARTREVGSDVFIRTGQFPVSIDRLDYKPAWSLTHVVCGWSDWERAAIGSTSKPMHKPISRNCNNDALPVVAIADFVIWETTTSPDPIAAPDVQDD